MKFEELINIAFFFSLADYENETLFKKILDVIKLQIMCIKNFSDGSNSMKNLLGIIDTKLVDKLENEVKNYSLKKFLKKINFRFPKT